MTYKHTLPLVFLMLAAATLACNLSGASSGDLQDGVIDNYKPAAGSSQNTFAYSTDQLDTLQKYGNPIRFDIIFAGNTRQETWYYDTVGYIVAFEDGTILAEQFFVPFYLEMYATTYTPDLFYRGMGIDEIAASSGKTSFVLTTIEGMPEESRLMHLEGLSVGLVNGQISFVETWPSVNEIKLEPEDFASEAPARSQDTTPVDNTETQAQPQNLTSEEAACAGSHQYEAVYYLDAEEYGRGNVSSEFIFGDDSVIWNIDNDTFTLTRLEQNTYFIEEVSTFFLAFEPGGFVSALEEDGSTYETIYTRMD